MPSPGSLLQQRYEVVRVLGAGGMGRVYLARHRGLGEMLVALKELDLHLPPEDLQLVEAEFQREATLLAHLQHRCLVRASDFFEEGGRMYIVMDYVAGTTLHQFTQQQSGLLPIDQVLDWAAQLCDVLHYLHSQTPPVLHRDIKPANVLLQDNGQVRLIDFGLSRYGSRDQRTASIFAGAGTPGFCPVEQYHGGTDVRSDIYSLGATLYYLFTREIPANSVAILAGEESLLPPRQFNRDISFPLQDVVLKMMALKREQRYSSIEEVARALERVSRGGGGELRREFRVCALCRHLGCEQGGDAEYLFDCKVLGWKTREQGIGEAAGKALSIDPGSVFECPHWAPI